jgi:cell division cycle 20-like protein 1 (cofactor of APC complex)
MSPPTTPSRNSTHRFSSPASSSRRPVYSDRFIPSRTTTNLEEALDRLDSKIHSKDSQTEVLYENQSLMNNLLRSELLGQYESTSERRSSLDSSMLGKSPNRKESSSSSSNVFKYRSSTGSTSILRDSEAPEYNFITSPAKRTAILSPTKAPRKIPKTPFKMLDAPYLQDDYYLNLVDWSGSNILAVALGSSVYLWSACTSKVSTVQ